jgi:hypothetical protein
MSELACPSATELFEAQCRAGYVVDQGPGLHPGYATNGFEAFLGE